MIIMDLSVVTVLPSLSAVGSWEEVLLFTMDFTVSQNVLELVLQETNLCLKPEMWQKVAKFKGAEYFRKALYKHAPFKKCRTKKRYSPWFTPDLTALDQHKNIL